jgi:ORF6N domain
VAKRTQKETSGREIVPASTAALIPRERIERSILFLRGEKVMLDADLAALYGVTTRRLNEQVRRNWERFPPDFFFQLTAEEKAEVVANCDHLTRMRFSSALPLAFTEHGAIMAASVLSSKRAIDASIVVVRVFVSLRQLLASHEELARKLGSLEKKCDAEFEQVYDTIRALMSPPEEDLSKKDRIGFDGVEAS